MKIIKSFIICLLIAIISDGFTYASSTTIAIDNNKVSSSNSLTLSVAPTPSTTNPLVASTPQTPLASTNASTTNSSTNSTNPSTTIVVDSNKVNTSPNSLSLSIKPAPSTDKPQVIETLETTTDSVEDSSVNNEKDEEIDTKDSTEKQSTTNEDAKSTTTPATIPTTTSTPAPSSTPSISPTPSSNNIQTTIVDQARSDSSSSSPINSSSTTTDTVQTPAATSSSSKKEDIPAPPIIKLNSFLISVHIQNNFTKDANLKQIELSLSGKEKSTASNKLNIKLPGVKNMYDRGSITSFDITTKDTSTKSFNGIESIMVDTDTISLNNKGVGWSSAHPIYITQKDGKWVLDI